MAAEDNDERLLFEYFGEKFPVIRPLSQLPNRVSLAELYPHLKTNRGTSSLAPDDTAVIAEIRTCSMISHKTRSVACSIRNSPVLLCIRNTLLSTSIDAFGPMLFPRSRIAIKSGLFRSFKPSKGSLIQAIYVACPNAVEFLGLAEADESKVSNISDPAARASKLRSFGDAAVEENEFVQASLWHSAAAEAAAASGDDMQLLAEVHICHSFCMLSMLRYELAISSASKALEAAPDFSKALYFRGMGFYWELNNRAALADFRRALEIDPDYKNARRQASIAAKLIHQQENGEYDVKGFFLGGCKHDKAPEWAEFISEAIEIRMTGDGRGRGVFLTRDVKLGELLMVSNPLVTITESQEDLYLLSLCAWSSSSRVRRIFRLLQQGDSSSAKDQMPLPNIRDFTAAAASDDRCDEEDIDVEMIKKTTDMASRLSFNMSPASRLNLGAGTRKQVFGLPNFINHSCLPNSSLMVVGGALFIRAATSIQAGEEITISYIDCLQPLATRSKMLSKAGWDFTCRCQRCEVENRYKAQLPGHQVSSLEGSVKRVDKLESVLGKMKSISEEERGMIQVGHIQAYLQVAGNKAESKLCRQIDEKFKLLSEIDAMQLLRRFVPGHGRAIALIARIVREYVLRLDWHPSFEVEFDAAMVAIIGDISLPPVDYITLLDHLESDENVSDLFGPAACG